MDANKPFKHSFKDKTRESLNLCVYNCGAQKCAPGDGWGEGVRDHYLIHAVLSGKGSYLCDGRTYTLQSGDLFIIYPHTPIRYWADSSDPWEYNWVGFNGAEASFLLRQTDFSPQRPVLHYEDPRIPAALAGITQAHGSKLSHQTRMIGRLYEFLSVLLELSTYAAKPDAGFDYVASATKYIAFNYAAPIDISDIARSIGVSRSHLYRVFMRSMNITPNDYLTRYRISQACELLRNQKLPIGAVANSVGYEDPLYFSRVFKRIVGLAPRDYAARERADKP